MKYIATLSTFILTGCLHNPPASDFDRVESFIKPIDTGLYFIREVDSKGVFIEKEKPIGVWKVQAQSLCPSGYKTLLINDDDLGPFVIATPGTSFMSSIDGIVLCNSSPFSEKEATQILIDELYIVPEQT
tara:strand:+ start:1131 stop:1520 length:390 start_codon:yes stop_codon:yes gene_type:complete